jgi:hypothetical protein
MKFYRSGEFDENVLEKVVDFNPKENAERFFLKRLNYLIRFIRENASETLNDFLSRLEGKYQSLVKSDYVGDRSLDLNSLVSELSNVAAHPSLIKFAMNYYLQILGLSDEKAWDEEIQVVNRNYHQAFLHPRYYNLLSLVDAMGREEAIRLWKRFFTHYIIDNRTPRDTPFVDLETLLKERIASDEAPSDWVVVRGMIADGKYAYRNDNCLWVDSLDDLPDSELKYYICCYGDYEGARNYHDSIVLTMEHTIAQGDPYCSRVLHDTRVDYDLRHPPKKFWDDMTPTKT